MPVAQSARASVSSAHDRLLGRFDWWWNLADPGSASYAYHDVLDLTGGSFTVDGTSILIVDVNNLPEGTISGAVVYGSRNGSFTQDSTHIQTINNPNNLIVKPVYNGTSLDLTLTVNPNDWFSNNMPDSSLQTLARADFNDDKSITYSDMLGLFAQAESAGPLTSAEMQSLQALVTTSGAAAVNMTSSVQNLSYKVVDGDPANAHFQGETLGHLNVGDPATKLQNLVAKWFLGADHPTIDMQYLKGSLSTTHSLAAHCSPAASPATRMSIRGGGRLLAASLLRGDGRQRNLHHPNHVHRRRHHQRGSCLDCPLL